MLCWSSWINNATDPKSQRGKFSIKQKITDVILEEKSKNKDPIFIIGGDLNKRDISSALQDYVGFKELQHGPTRGLEKLDVTHCNV